MKFFAKPNGFPLLALLCALAVAAPSAHADFWVGNNNAGTLQYFNTSTDTIKQTINFNVYGTGNHSPGGIALDSSNNLWVADPNGNSGTLAEYTYNSNTGQWNTGVGGQPTFDVAMPGGSSSPEGIAIYNGSVYVVARGTGSNESVLQYNFSSNTPTWSTAISYSEFPQGAWPYPQGIAINSSGNLFVSDNSAIYEFSNSGSLLATLTGVNNAYGLTFDTNGNLFAASQNNGEILEYANSSGTYSTTPTTVASIGSNSILVGLAFDPTTGYLLTANAYPYGTYPNKVLAYSPPGSPSSGTLEKQYSPSGGGQTGPEPSWLAGFDSPLVVTAPAPSGLVLFALGFGILGLMYCRKQRSDSLHPFVAA